MLSCADSVLSVSWLLPVVGRPAPNSTPRVGVRSVARAVVSLLAAACLAGARPAAVAPAEAGLVAASTAVPVTATSAASLVRRAAGGIGCLLRRMERTNAALTVGGPVARRRVQWAPVG